MAWLSTGRMYEEAESDEYGQLSLPYFIMEALNETQEPVLSTDLARYLEDELAMGITAEDVGRELVKLQTSGYVRKT